MKTVVTTTFSEQETVGPLIEEVRAQGFDKIMVVDGSPRDRTTEFAAGLGAEVVFQHGKGKAGALLTAFQRVTTPYIVIMDGDGSYNPSDIQKLLPLMRTYDFVKGVRENNENMSGTHKLGNRIVTRTFNLLFGTSIGDVCSGMYMLSRDLWTFILILTLPGPTIQAFFSHSSQLSRLYRPSDSSLMLWFLTMLFGNTIVDTSWEAQYYLSWDARVGGVDHSCSAKTDRSKTR